MNSNYNQINNNNNNNDNDNSSSSFESSNSNNKVYNLVWGNNYIKSIILKHLSIFNLLNVNIRFSLIEEFQEFKLKEYLYDVTLGFEYDLELLPKNIERLALSYPKNKDFDQKVTIPSHIKSFGLLHIHKSNFDSNYFKSICSSTLLSFNNLEIIREIRNTGKYSPAPYEIEPNSIPSSVTELYIEESFEKSVFKKNVLPANLKKLYIRGVHEFEDGCLPDSLEDVTFNCIGMSLVNQLPTNSLVKLGLFLRDTSDCKVTDIIKFPNTLEELIIRCGSFNSSLPDNLKMLDLFVSYKDQDIIFPPNLEYLRFRYYNGRDELISKSPNLPKKLKYLDIQITSIVDDNNVPLLSDGLETLILRGVPNNTSFNYKIKPNQLPSTLTYLDLGPSFNQEIDANVLPANLKTLILGQSFNQFINPLSIPINLELLELLPDQYQHPLKDLVASHPKTLIKCSKDYFPSYYQQFELLPESLHSLILPEEFEESISSLNLQDKSNLQHFSFGDFFCGEFELSDFPINNNIKTLEIGKSFYYNIILDHFRNVETIKIKNNSPEFKILSSRDENNNLNLYNLKQIIIESSNDFIKTLDIEFYKLLKRSTESTE